MTLSAVHTACERAQPAADAPCPDSGGGETRLDAPSTSMQTPHQPPITVAVLVAAYLEHAAAYYAGTRQPANLRATLGRLVADAGDTPAHAYRARDLADLRDRLAARGRLSRGYINRLLSHARQCWRWGVAQELVGPESLDSLSSVRGLRLGRTDAPEPRAVGPVSPETIAATLPHLSPPIAAMVQLLRLTGARTGEIRLMRCGEIDASRPDVWVYRPGSHKTAWRGHQRVIPLDGPCQRVLVDYIRPFFPGDPVFMSPRGGFYGECSVGQAVRRACLSAGIEPWHPHQIRHLVLTEARAALAGDHDALQGLAGHARLSTTEIYARASEAAAIRAQQALRRYAT